MLGLRRRISLSIGRFMAAGVIAGAIAGAGCGAASRGPDAMVAEGIVPEFALPDVNPNSRTSGQTITPRAYLGQVSAWYFGHST